MYYNVIIWYYIAVYQIGFHKMKFEPTSKTVVAGKESGVGNWSFPIWNWSENVWTKISDFFREPGASLKLGINEIYSKTFGLNEKK